MTLFTASLGQMAVLFTLLLLGFALVRLKALPSSGAGVLARLQTLLLVPALVLGTFAEQFSPAKLGAASRLLGLGALSGLLMCLVAVGVSRLAVRAPFDRSVCTYGLAFSNFAFCGNAVVSAVFPDVFLEYLIFTLPLWAGIYMWAVPELFLSGGQKQTLRQRAKNLLNPMFIAMALGMAIGLTGLHLPGFLARTVSSLGSCMSPIAMLLTGMAVADMDLGKTLRRPAVYLMCALRLLVFPLAAVALIPLLHMDQTSAVCLVCSLAMPIGLNVVVIPAAYGQDVTLGAGLVIASHLLAALTIPLVFRLMEMVL